MAQQTINVGTTPGDETGDPARIAFGKVNANTAELYAALDSKVGTDGGILLDVVITQAAYDALDPKVPTTRYNIVG